MSTEQFDKKIKKALENQSVAFDNKAWDKMELLLDKHMPVRKEKDRKIFILLFLFLIAGGGTYLYLKNNYSNRETAAATETTSGSAVSSDKLNEKKPANKNSTPDKTSVQPVQTPEPGTKNADRQTILSEKQANNEIVSVTTPSFTGNKKSSKNKPGAFKSDSRQEKNSIANENISQNQITTDWETFILNPPVNSVIDPLEINNKREEVQNRDKLKNENPVHTDLATLNKNITDKQKNNSSFLEKFFVTASAGADVSVIETNTIGEVKFIYGAGLGYNISRRFAVRTGFYVANKVYSTNPEYYHPPSNFWTYYPNLKQVDANCRVYEVPLVADYSFGFKKDHSWFASAGLSSLFMKKEEYNYYYKPINSPDYIYKGRTIENENKHYFSVLSLSGGYTGNLSNHFSLRAEPYIKVALTGIGYGGVKLNSGGLLISAIYRPFASRK